MGVLNVTPDSFSDGGAYSGQGAVDAGLRMMEDGADLIDVGGESTRPGAEPVPLDEELRRVMPVVEGLCAQGVPLSIDTSKAEVARQALACGALVVNDVTALADPEMMDVVAKARCTVCLMHMKGSPQSMQRRPEYSDVVAEVTQFLVQRMHSAMAGGVLRSRIWLDPGIGFGKTTAHNLALLRNLNVLVALGFPVLVGASRKAFIGRVLGSEDEPLSTDERLEGTIAAHVLAQAAGARVIRAHDVREGARAMRVAGAILRG